jgi:hypothetical protein
VFYVGKYVWVYVGVYTKSKSSELSPLRSNKMTSNGIIGINL